ncbi:acyltransferase [Microbacterium sp. NPDC091313]
MNAAWRSIVDRAYGRQRGLGSGLDPELVPLDIIGFLGVKAAQAARAIIRGWPGRFLGRRVTIVGRRHIRMGRSISIADGVELRAVSRRGIELDDSVTIDTRAVLRASGVLRNLGEGIVVGARTSIGMDNFIQGAGFVRIGCDCLIGPGVTILSENHIDVDVAIPIREQGERRSPTVIEDNVWIGAHAVILPGAHVGHGSIIAAGAVIRGHVAPYSVMGGVPGRLIKSRISSSESIEEST